MDDHTEVRLAQLEKKIDEIYDAVKHLRRAQIAARNRKMLYWVVVIVLGTIAYYSIRPYLIQLQSIYDMTQQASSNYGELLGIFGQKKP